jgi:thiopeptide-type bacteriocin biosynthesis protein
VIAPPAPAGPAAWVSAHIFHAGDLDALITQVAGPLAATLDLDGFFFLRYWEGGPHLRLRLLVTGPGQARAARRELAGRARAHLGAHPSTRATTDAQYAAMAARMARGERLAGHDERLHPNDCVEFIAYQPEHHAYGNAACVTAVERHFTESSRLALRLLSGPLEPGQRAAIALAAVTMTLAACRADPALLPADLPPETDAIYLAQRGVLRPRARLLWTAAESHRLAAWARSIQTLRDALTRAGCAPRDAGSPLGHLARSVPSAHRPVASVLLRCTHLLSNRIGLPPAAEHRAGLLAARILSDLHHDGEIA